MKTLDTRLKVTSGAPSAGVMTHAEIADLTDDEIVTAIRMIKREIGDLLPAKPADRQHSLQSAQFRRRLAQLAMNKRILEEELSGRPHAAAS